MFYSQFTVYYYSKTLFSIVPAQLREVLFVTLFALPNRLILVFWFFPIIGIFSVED